MSYIQISVRRENNSTVRAYLLKASLALEYLISHIFCFRCCHERYVYSNLFGYETGVSLPKTIQKSKSVLQGSVKIAERKFCRKFCRIFLMMSYKMGLYFFRFYLIAEIHTTDLHKCFQTYVNLDMLYRDNGETKILSNIYCIFYFIY